MASPFARLFLANLIETPKTTPPCSLFSTSLLLPVPQYQVLNPEQENQKWEKHFRVLGFIYKLQLTKMRPKSKATVTVDEHTFESLEFFTNLNQAEHAAAKVALTSLSLDGFQEEFCQREGLSMPMYMTIKSGASYMPVFYSTVEVKGEVFYGRPRKSKKEAEINASAVACSALIESGQSQGIGLSSHTTEANRASISTCNSDLAVTVDYENPQEKADAPTSLVSNYTYNSEDDILHITQLVQEVHSTETKAAYAKSNSDESIPCMDDTLSSFHIPTSPKGCSILSPQTTIKQLPDVSSLSISNSIGTPAETRSYLVCNSVRVYTCNPEITFPKGITLVPISNNRWVAVSLEFLNETN